MHERERRTEDGTYPNVTEERAKTEARAAAVGSPQSAVPAAERDLVFVDTETLGLDERVHDMIEITAVRIPARDIAQPSFALPRLALGTVSSPQSRYPHVALRVKPERVEHASAKAIEVNGYTPEKWAGAHLRVDAVAAFLERMFPPDRHEPIVVGQNTWFDWRFILAAIEPTPWEAPKPKYLIDTASMGWRSVARGIVEKPSLEKLCDLYRVGNVGAHGSIVDVARTIAIYRAMVYGYSTRYEDGACVGEG